MTTPGADGQAFEQLQGLLLNVADFSDFLRDVARLAVGVSPAATSCGMTMRYSGSFLTVGSSDDRAELLDETQYRTGAGPSLDATVTHQVVTCPDLQSEQRWPAYRAAAADTGLRCSASFPLSVGDEPFGAMNVYGFDRSHAFGEPELRSLTVFAAQASGAMRIATRLAKDAALISQMEEALRSRTVIDQAMGIVIERQHCTAAAAFDLLRRQSQNSHVRLRDVAATLVSEATGERPSSGRGFNSA